MRFYHNKRAHGPPLETTHSEMGIDRAVGLLKSIRSVTLMTVPEVWWVGGVTSRV